MQWNIWISTSKGASCWPLWGKRLRKSVTSLAVMDLIERPGEVKASL